MILLGVQDVSKRYGPVVALDRIDLSVPAGSRTVIVGPSGSGKTTLLRIIAGFEVPDAGRITLDGEVLADGPHVVPAHRRGIGFVPQDGALFPHLSVARNIGFGLDRAMPGRDARILDLMDMVELDRKMLDRRPHELSGGQQQRVALARALARKPRLMLLDEPFSALDAGLRETMRKAVAKVLQAAGITAILVTHDQAEALSFADQVAVLRDSRLAQVGAPQDIYRHPADRKTAEFLGDTIVLSADLRDGWAECRLGRVAVDAPARRGKAEIMLRPEQVQLVQAGPEVGEAEAHGCYGQVTDVEFAGAVCMVAVSLLIPSGAAANAAMSGAPLMIRSLSNDLPPVGSRVRITVTGKAHVFEA